ncbi:development-specific protein LVN1.2-like [Diadema antillarum]|uniref:development-specific protein LVN1.2-like n=1 Tax=Diadema antillarum TaxID=105358 RepID=UPI003A867955
MKLQVFLVLVAAAAVSAQRPCCSPKQYMTGIGTTGVYTSPEGTQPSTTFIYGAFDFEERKFGFDISVDYLNGTTLFFKIIQHYAEKTQWVILANEGLCLEQPAYEPEPSNCIHEGSRYDGNFVSGGPNGLKVKSYTYDYKKPSETLQGLSTITVTEDSCFFVGSSFLGTRNDIPKGSSIFETSGFIDTKVGIEDPERWLRLPELCRKQSNMTSSALPKDMPDLSKIHIPRFF